ncbi:helix-turn-helix domain-containing protein [Streptomyces xantholiticus]|uniref:helix-turn-helix domain-containing protein n=1 Tax=Streptomyces xantholiticus TaxID=68285 RepID=UPI001674B7B4|nr:helix-turn-helix transcriptional regulator [Streptomyces xantholiticus]GGW73094.1 hypothetical protein GCM10010381_67300 [Streptomyces xantholiticus]
MANVADEGTGGDGQAVPARRGLGQLKSKPFEGRPRKLALVRQLRALVTTSGRTSKAIAAQLNVSPSLLSKFLSGERIMDRSTVETLVQVCEVTDEVRAQLLRLHTAALAEAHPQFADRLEKADAYEETALHCQQLQTRCESLTAERRQLQTAYEALECEHESTKGAHAATEEALRDQERRHQEAVDRLTARLREEQQARQADRAEFQELLRQARSEHEEQLRRSRQEEAGIREELRRQEAELQALQLELERSAQDVTAVRQERDRARLELAQLREELVGLQVELAAAEAEQQRRDDEDALLAQARQAIESVLDQQPDDSPEQALTSVGAATALQAEGHPHVAQGATSRSRPSENQAAAPPAPLKPAPEPSGNSTLLHLAALGSLLAAYGLFGAGMFQLEDARRATFTGVSLVVSGLLMLLFVFPPLIARAATADGIDLSESGDEDTYGYYPMM